MKAMADLEYSDADMHEILKRAASIDGNANLSRHVLEQTAAELGISKEALERAEAEYRDQQGTRSQREAYMKSRQAEFNQHLVSYCGVNLFLIGVWWFTGRGYPWFIWPIMGWGLGMFMHAFSLRTTQGEEFERGFQEWLSKQHSRV